MNSIIARQIKKSYGSAEILPGLDLEVAEGEMFALLGPNGSGKTTLFRILTTLITPDSGTAEIAGFDVVKQPASVREHIGVVFQSPSLDKKLSARENLIYGGALYGLSGHPLRERIAELSQALRLEEKLDSLVETLSGGQQRRVEIAKCLLTRPAILLLDEPSTGLDPAARMDLWALIATLRSENKMTVVFTSHLMDESQRADRVGIMAAGRLVRVGEPAALLAEAGPLVLRISTTAPSDVVALLQRECGLVAHSLEGEVRVSTADAHAIAAKLSIATEVLSTTVAKPTLEDVFLFTTGKRLHE